MTTTERTMHIRPARLDEATALTDLAVRATGHWGYDAAFLAAARLHLEVEPATISAGRVHVLDAGGHIFGFHGLLGDPPDGRLHWLFVEPGEIGHGHGRRLWDDALDLARAAGFGRLIIESDRFAEPFFVAMGAQRVGEELSPVDTAPLTILVIDL